MPITYDFHPVIEEFKIITLNITYYQPHECKHSGPEVKKWPCVTTLVTGGFN